MAKDVSEEDVRKAIVNVMHPAIDRSLIDLGIVKGISIKNGRAVVTFAFPFPNIPIKELLINSIREPIEKLGLKVDVKETVMNQQEREAFLAMEQESWKL